MKITKKIHECDVVDNKDAVKECDAVESGSDFCVDSCDEAFVSTDCYTGACSHIQEAINILCACAVEDPKAQEALANLSVILFDLQA